MLLSCTLTHHHPQSIYKKTTTVAAHLAAVLSFSLSFKPRNCKLDPTFHFTIFSTMGSCGEDVKTLEHVTLKVPYEVLNKKFRATQKVLDKEMSGVNAASVEIEKILVSFPPVSISPTGNHLAGGSAGDVVSGQAQLSQGCDEVPQGSGDVEDKKLKKSIAVIRSGFQSSGVENKGSEDGDAGGGDDSETNSLSSDNKSGSEETSGSKGARSKVKGKDVAKLLGVLADRLGSLKRKAGEYMKDEIEAARAVKQRISHLQAMTAQDDVVPPPAGYSKGVSNDKHWKRVRLNRMLVDHLLREGMYDTAKMLSEDLGITELTNVEVFWAAKEVEESLQRHETARMVAWCYENKSRLRKIRSTLELEIRTQEFVELVRCGRRGDAVKHARRYLAASEPEHIAAVKKCMGLLAFPLNTTLAPYVELLSPERWTHLVSHFRQEHARLYQLSSTSVLGAVVQAGLASLKTPQCYRATTKNPNCPVCTDPLSTLASNLPFAHCAHSQLVCAISGEPLNENNPPLLLPSGFVYGTRSLQDMARTNGGKVICPRTSKVHNLVEAEKVYVM